MTTSTWITMIVIMVCVWGGFFWVLLTAIRKVVSYTHLTLPTNLRVSFSVVV